MVGVPKELRAGFFTEVTFQVPIWRKIGKKRRSIFFKGYPLQKYKLTVESYIMSHFVDFHLRLTLIANFIFEFWQPPP